jgi:broad specificity phosphatase PhoE
MTMAFSTGAMRLPPVESVLLVVRHGSTFGDKTERLVKGCSDACVTLEYTPEQDGDGPQRYVIAFDFLEKRQRELWEEWKKPFLLRQTQQSETPFKVTICTTSQKIPPIVRNFLGDHQECKRPGKLDIQFTPFSLTEEGYQSVSDYAQQIVTLLREKGICSVNILHSPRIRATQTAQIILERFTQEKLNIGRKDSSLEIDDFPFRRDLLGYPERVLVQKCPDQAQNLVENPRAFLDNQCSWDFVEPEILDRTRGQTPMATYTDRVKIFTSRILQQNPSFANVLVTHDIPARVIGECYRMECSSRPASAFVVIFPFPEATVLKPSLPLVPTSGRRALAMSLARPVSPINVKPLTSDSARDSGPPAPPDSEEEDVPSSPEATTSKREGGGTPPSLPKGTVTVPERPRQARRREGTSSLLGSSPVRKSSSYSSMSDLSPPS